MTEGDQLYALYRRKRGYLPEWSKLTPWEKSRFEGIMTNMDNFLGGIYIRHKREEFVRSTGRSMNHPANLCCEITLLRIGGPTATALKMPRGWSRGRG